MFIRKLLFCSYACNCFLYICIQRVFHVCIHRYSVGYMLTLFMYACEFCVVKWLRVCFCMLHCFHPQVDVFICMRCCFLLHAIIFRRQYMCVLSTDNLLSFACSCTIYMTRCFSYAGSGVVICMQLLFRVHMFFVFCNAVVVFVSTRFRKCAN